VKNEKERLWMVLAANVELCIDSAPYRVAEHPAAPGLPYGQEGRQAVVYQLLAKTGHRALKVFKPRYRLPALVYLGEQLEHYARLPGLAVCRRTVLTPQRHAEVLRQHPDMIYAVLMPWIEGPTWMQVVLDKRELTPEQSLDLARGLAHVLATMEQRGLAHCDLSGPNVMLPELVGDRGVALVDVEQMYSPEFRRPAAVPGGSPGYAHRMAPDGLWAEEADRFAGAVLLAEMLGWCDERVREATWGENYFEPREMQRDSDRFRTLLEVLRMCWGAAVANLLERAWHSDVLSECATLGEWLLQIPGSVPHFEGRAPQAKPSAGVSAVPDLEQHGKLESAREARAAAQPQPVGKAKQTLTEPAAEQKREGRSAEPSRVGTSTAQLFSGGRDAYDRQEWGKAKELLAEVVRREPGYAKDGVAASALLRRIERQRWLQRSKGLLAALGVLFLAAILWTAASLIRQRQVMVRARATATAIAGATCTEQARAAATMLAETATARAPETATSLAYATAAAQATRTGALQSMATGQAEATATEQAAATARASATAAAQARQAATAELQATGTAEVQGAATAAAEQTAAAAATATQATAAQQTATAQARPTTIASATRVPALAGRILFASGDATGVWLYVTDVQTGDTRKLADLGNFSAGANAKSNAPQYAWSPDGKRVAYVYGPYQHWDELYLIDEQGGSKVGLPSKNGTSALAWSPNGRQLLYVGFDWGEGDQIFTVDPDNGTRGLLRANHNGEQYRGISWSPDGTQLAIISSLNSTGNHRLCIMGADGGDPRLLTPSVSDYQSPAWSPDGTLIAFSSNRDGNYEIYTIEPSGSNLRRLTSSPSSDFTPSWSPDGYWIAFASDRDGIMSVYIMDGQGGSVRRVITQHSMAPVWGK
jgi:hypothetical protein